MQQFLTTIYITFILSQRPLSYGGVHNRRYKTG